MSIEETNRLDIVVRTPQNEIGLVMTAFNAWDDPALVNKLSEKLGVYAAYSKSKEFKKEHGKTPVRIILSTSVAPTPAVNNILDDFSSATGIPTQVDILPFGG